MVLLTTKEFLEQGLFLDLEIKTKREEIGKLERLVEETNKGLVVENQISIKGLQDMISEYSDSLVKDITKLIYYKHSIITKINEVENSRDRILLKLRYIDFMTWYQIAEEMEYSSMQIQRIHKAILKDMTI